MTVQVVAPVRRTVDVNAPIDVAFSTFTERMTAWWPATHHIALEPYTALVIEPRAGGRWYEREVQRRECGWGTVLVWDPPAGVTLSWAISPQFQAETDPARASEIEVRFTAIGASRTRVDLEHRHFERHGEGADQVRGIVDFEGGWGGILAGYAASAPESQG